MTSQATYAKGVKSCEEVLVSSTNDYVVWTVDYIFGLWTLETAAHFWTE